MKMDELLAIRKDIDDLLVNVKTLEAKSKYISEERINGITISYYLINKFPSHSSTGFHDSVYRTIRKIVDTFSTDIFRIAEMSYAAEIRNIRTKVKLKEEQLTRYFTDEEETK